MKYSFIIPMYNEEEDIEKTVLCCMKQEAGPFESEIIMIDDGSTDHTYDICLKMVQAGKNTQLIKNEYNKGVSYSRNRGVHCSTGDVVVFLNADEMVASDYLLSIHQHYQSGADYVFPQTRVANVNTAYGHYRDCYRQARYYRPNQFMWSQGFSCRKKLFDQIGGFSEEYPGCGGEDWDFVSRLELLKKNRVVDLDIVVKHTVPHSFYAVLWHMYNRGRGSAYYDIIFGQKSALKFSIKWVVFSLICVLIFVIDYRTALFCLSLYLILKLLEGIRLLDKMNCYRVRNVFFYLVDCIIRSIGYRLTFLKRIGQR